MTSYRAELFLILLFTSCAKNSKVLQKVSDDRVLFEAIKECNSEETNYKVRVNIKEAGSQVSQKLQYQPDSCFFLLCKNEKVYPDGVTPIANGRTQSFEYLLYFPKQENDDNEVLVYKDKYGSQKEYKLLFKY